MGVKLCSYCLVLWRSSMPLTVPPAPSSTTLQTCDFEGSPRFDQWIEKLEILVTMNTNPMRRRIQLYFRSETFCSTPHSLIHTLIF
ncbi:hypothetical protein P175DRAFT_0560462 [Aspergillus ochraceoroseus IBT 24754]|uniref:Uncharacterized protein n=1 Tax=Aspergillus ochraceoroseus IBT 24754 TaxID=1392256 RepID=A0A2T5LNB4_9EURO|nr:uncharacterized protein P175DRAFT_0560462 [Aspergillus ochraceoroseus IBT 24754]PTU17766.1 hypothetical protein P175DRAFT_0560462 [Aspergillus ochraceoroseus IBT 24754]